MKDGKIVSQTTYESDAKFAYSGFFEYLTAVCSELDISTPVLMKTHIFNYAKFGTVTFRPRDFTEPVDFDKLILENASS